MPLDIGRARGAADVTIDHGRCTVCGLCVEVCKGAPLYLAGDKVQVDQGRLYGCVGCGHCATVCPQGCITVSGRDLYPDDVVDLPPPELLASYDCLRALMATRRSVRDYCARDVEPELVKKIIDAASSAPMGIPPSEVGVLVLARREKVSEFKNDLLSVMRASRWLFSPLVLALLRPFMPRDSHAALKSFVTPAIDAYLEKDAEGVDWFFYDAPLALYFHASPVADPADPFIVATYAVLAAQSLGLASCMLGFPGQLLKYSSKVKAKYHLPRRIQPGLAVVFGYPRFAHRRALVRRFAEVRYH